MTLPKEDAGDSAESVVRLLLYEANPAPEVWPCQDEEGVMAPLPYPFGRKGGRVATLGEEAPDSCCWKEPLL